MGKWASGRRGGSAPQHGNIAAPAPADWSITNVTPTTIDLNRIASFPAGATQWGWLIVVVSNGGVFFQANQVATPKTITGMSAIAYRVSIAWFNGNTRVSDYSASVLVVPS